MLLHWPARTSRNAWTAAQKDRYRQDGYVVVERVFSPGECRRFARHMNDLSAETRQLDGLGRQANYGATYCA